MTLFHHLFLCSYFCKIATKKGTSRGVPIPASATTPQIRAQPECAVTIFYGHADFKHGICVTSLFEVAVQG